MWKLKTYLAELLPVSESKGIYRPIVAALSPQYSTKIKPEHCELGVG